MFTSDTARKNEAKNLLILTARIVGDFVETKVKDNIERSLPRNDSNTQYIKSCPHYK
jgi:hypothetical protein